MITFDYAQIRRQLEAFLLLVGQKVMEIRRAAEFDPNLAQLKADKTIVTQGDTAAEDLIREWITARFPDDTIRGEERERKDGSSHVWIIDPIDGTYNYNHFGKKYGISVGLVDGNEPKLGVIHYPAETVTVSASKGVPARINGAQLIASRGEDSLVYSSIAMPLNSEHLANPKYTAAAKQQAPLLNVASCVDVGWSHTFAFLKFLQGSADAILHWGATPYDIGAACSIAKELGMEISGYNGQPIDFSREVIPIVISKTVKLHQQIIKALNQAG